MEHRHARHGHPARSHARGGGARALRWLGGEGRLYRRSRELWPRVLWLRGPRGRLLPLLPGPNPNPNPNPIPIPNPNPNPNPNPSPNPNPNPHQVFCAFVLLNLVIAVILENFSSTAAESQNIITPDNTAQVRYNLTLALTLIPTLTLTLTPTLALTLALTLASALTPTLTLTLTRSALELRDDAARERRGQRGHRRGGQARGREALRPPLGLVHHEVGLRRRARGWHKLHSACYHGVSLRRAWQAQRARLAWLQAMRQPAA